MAGFFQVARERHSVRRHKPDPVSDQDIEQILEAARWASTGANTRPGEFIVVRERDLLGKIASMLVESRERMFTYDPLYVSGRLLRTG